MLEFINTVVLLPYSVGKYLFSIGVYWFIVSYVFKSEAFNAFWEYMDERWNYWVKKMQNRRK